MSSGSRNWACALVAASMLLRGGAFGQVAPLRSLSFKDAVGAFEKDGDQIKLTRVLQSISERRGGDFALSLVEMIEVWKSTRNDALLSVMVGYLTMAAISTPDVNQNATESEAFQRVLSFLESNPPSPVGQKTRDWALMGIFVTANTGAQPTVRGQDLIYIHATRGNSDTEFYSLVALGRLRPFPQRAKEILLLKLESGLRSGNGFLLAEALALRPCPAELRESVTNIISHHLFNGKGDETKRSLEAVLLMSGRDPLALLPLLRLVKERGALAPGPKSQVERRVGEIEYAERLRTGSVNEASKSGLPIVIQAPPSEDSPGVDSHVVFGMFFRHHHGLTEQTGQLALARPAEAPKLTEGLARLLRIREDEQAKVALISKAAISDLDRIGKAARTYAETLRPGAQPLNDPVGRQFALERAQVLNRAIGELRSQLSEGSWKGLQSYINDELRLQIVKVKAQRTNVPVIVVPPKAR